MISTPFHSALVVPEVHSALDQLSRAFGLEWSSIRESETAVWTPEGRVDLTFRGAFSKPGPTRIEIIESIDGTLWSAPDDVVLHHVSFWSSDLINDARHLAEDGFPMMATSWGDDGQTPTLFTYHRKGRGPYMELLDENERPHYEEWWNES
jgi:hypothetical protein